MGYIADYLNALVAGTERTEVRAALAAQSPVEILGQSGTAIDHTGTLVETALATVVIAAGKIAINDMIEVEALWKYPNNANNKTPKHYLGGLSGAAFYNPSALTTTNSIAVQHLISVRESLSKQVCTVSGTSTPFGTQAFNPFTATQNLALASSIVFAATLGNTGDTMTLERYRVLLWRAPV